MNEVITLKLHYIYKLILSNFKVLGSLNFFKDLVFYKLLINFAGLFKLDYDLTRFISTVKFFSISI